MAIDHPIPVEVLRQLVRLDYETGRLYWLHRDVGFFDATARRSAAHMCANWNSRHAGAEAFCTISDQGYFYGMLFNRNYKAHRIVFALLHGDWPPEHLDHINGDRRDNRPINLRAATAAENARNASSYRVNTGRGFCGVVWHPKTRKWQARIKTGGRKASLGYFSDEVDAARAYDRAARQAYGEFARLNFAD